MRHYNYTWFRAKTPTQNSASEPHCDIVYMGRGTPDLYTSWTPIGDIPQQMGDLLVFTMFTLHCSHTNQTDRLRISTDTRYQLASEPIDPRWIGAEPPGNDIRAKRGTIC